VKRVEARKRRFGAETGILVKGGDMKLSEIGMVKRIEQIMALNARYLSVLELLDSRGNTRALRGRWDNSELELDPAGDVEILIPICLN